MSTIVKRWAFPTGHSITAIAIRETDGTDEWQAARNRDAKGEGANYQAELLALGIVAYWNLKGEKVATEPGMPCSDWEAWSTKTRGLALKCFEEINGVAPKEVTSFLAKGAPAGADGEPLPGLAPPTK